MGVVPATRIAGPTMLIMRMETPPVKSRVYHDGPRSPPVSISIFYQVSAAFYQLSAAAWMICARLSTSLRSIVSAGE
jgi:hypothetical protein